MPLGNLPLPQHAPSLDNHPSSRYGFAPRTLTSHSNRAIITRLPTDPIDPLHTFYLKPSCIPQKGRMFAGWSPSMDLAHGGLRGAFAYYVAGMGSSGPPCGPIPIGPGTVRQARGW